MSIIKAEGPKCFERMLVSTISCSSGSSRVHALLSASRKYASLLPQGNVSKVRRFFSLGSSGSFSERSPRVVMWNWGKGLSYHSRVSSLPCLQSFFSISLRMCVKSCCTPTVQRPLLTPQSIFRDSASQACRSLMVIFMFDFLRSMLMESIRQLMEVREVQSCSVIYMDVGPLSS